MFETLPGFRDFPPEACAQRNHLFRVFRNVARAFDFREYDAPVLEPLDLYIEKSGPEIASQLFHFQVHPQVALPVYKLVRNQLICDLQYKYRNRSTEKLKESEI